MNTQEQNENLLEVDNSYWVNMATALERLHDNADFKKVILEGYFRDMAVSKVSLLANSGTIQGNHRPEVMEILVGISRLQDYFGMIMNLGHVPTEAEIKQADENLGNE